MHGAMALYLARYSNVPPARMDRRHHRRHTSIDWQHETVCSQSPRVLLAEGCGPADQARDAWALPQ